MKRFEILTKERLSEQIVSMDIYAPRIATSAFPGQFLIVVPSEQGERIPLTICDYDREKGIIRIVFQIIGNSTRKMEMFKVGDVFSDVVGPLGHPSEFVTEDWTTVSSRNILFVAGSVAAAPVYPQVKWMKERDKLCDVIIGARSANLMVLEKEMASVAGNLYLCTDDGSLGFNGRVDAMMRELIDNRGQKYDEIICIGPMIMMKTVAALASTYGIKTIVSLNSLMVDGTGMCGACRVTVGGKVKFTCVDGPEFDGSLVDFDEAMKRSVMYRQYEIGSVTSEHTCNLAAAVSGGAVAGDGGMADDFAAATRNTSMDTAVDTAVGTVVDTAVDTAVGTAVDTVVDTAVDTAMDTAVDTSMSTSMGTAAMATGDTASDMAAMMKQVCIKSENETAALQIPKASNRINSREQDPNIR
ncbi:MAG: sulfide/dihydroorotate dehydrogenase-like FAD/NAD-binding protein, partial [Bacteroidales bacterium]|nr:sulfide/dihydroorotate dehydrogenase-like FAD/NAD-binding protein [Bacteroidales bacterium]